jgi:protein gp37
MSTTKIELTNAVWNPTTGCTPVSDGCKNCYAKRFAHRLRGRCGYPADDPFRVTLHPERQDMETSPRGIDWCIVGGETGPNARPMHPDWVRNLVRQCQAAKVPFLLKQNGEWLHDSQDHPAKGDGMRVHIWHDGSYSWRVGKKAAGRLLDGRTWEQIPGVAR